MMILLDIRTILFCDLLATIICVVVIVLMWRQAGSHFTGMSYLFGGYVLQLAGVFLTVLRSIIPDLVSIILSNTLILAGAIFIYIALVSYTGRKRTQFHNYIIFLCFIGVHTYFTYIQPDLTVRNLNFSIGLLLIWLQCAWLMLYCVEPKRRSLTRTVGWVFAGFCFLNALRILDLLINTPGRTVFFQPRAFNALVMILLTYSIVLMINKSLLVEIREEEEKFSRAFHLSPYATALVELSSGRILNVNQIFLQNTGYYADEMIGKLIIDMHLWCNDSDRITVFRELKERGTVKERDFQFRAKSGEIIDGLFSAEVITIKGQQYVLSSFQNITKSKHVFQALQKSERFLQSIIEQSPYPMWIANKNGTLIKINQACREIFKLTEEEVLGKYNILQDNLVNEQGFMSVVKEVFAKGATARFDLHYDTSRLQSLQLQNKAVLLVDTTIFAIKDAQGNVTNAVIQFIDITARWQMEEENKRLNRELERKVLDRTRALHDTQLALLNLVDDLERTSGNLSAANASLTAANKELEAFSYSVSHDLRAPLRSVEGFSKAVLEDYADKLDEQGRDYLRRIAKGVRKMDLLTNDLLKLSRINTADISRQEFDLSEMAKAIMRDIQQKMNSLDSRQVNIQENILVRGDRYLIRIAMVNLLDNAWKFTGRTKQALIEIGSVEQDGKTVIFVRDNGAGFDMSYANKLFGVFQRLHSGEEFPGTGIGLATVQRIIHRHGGQIWAESEPDKGATFYFTLPD